MNPNAQTISTPGSGRPVFTDGVRMVFSGDSIIAAATVGPGVCDLRTLDRLGSTLGSRTSRPPCISYRFVHRVHWRCVRPCQIHKRFMECNQSTGTPVLVGCTSEFAAYPRGSASWRARSLIRRRHRVFFSVRSGRASLVRAPSILAPARASTRACRPVRRSRGSPLLGALAFGAPGPAARKQIPLSFRRGVRREDRQAGGSGFEPLLADPESAVLPLNEPPELERGTF